jgi:hypothetical protein
MGLNLLYQMYYMKFIIMQWFDLPYLGLYNAHDFAQILLFVGGVCIINRKNVFHSFPDREITCPPIKPNTLFLESVLLRDFKYSSNNIYKPSHVSPLYPSKQVHVNSLLFILHVPLFKQGKFEQGVSTIMT